MTGQALDALNQDIKVFGDRQLAFMRSENRALLRSILFDVPRRSSIGWQCVYDAAPGLLRRLVEQISPEEIGRRMRRLCSRPYYLQLSILMCSYLGARQQRLLDAGLSPGQPFAGEKVEDVLFIVDFWRRACMAYRSDGRLFPDQNDGAQPILPMETVAQLNNQLELATKGSRHRLRRLAATLELYVFILHGEQRDGLFAHGPYDAGQGEQVVVLEFTDLQNDFMPWAGAESRNPYSNLALVRRFGGGHPHFDIFGGVRWEESDLEPYILAEGLFTRTGNDEIVPLPLNEVERIETCAAAAQNELFLKAAEWSPRYKAEYGVYLFANHLRSFFDLASPDGEWDGRIRCAFETAAANVLEPMLKRDEPPSIWSYMATTDGDLYWPVSGKN